MRLVINGKETQTADELMVSGLLKERNVKWADMVSVELNGTIVDRADFETTALGEGDQVEFLYFMGGGRGVN